MRPSPCPAGSSVKATKMTAKKERRVIINGPYQSVACTKLGLSSINDKMPMATVLFSWDAWEVFLATVTSFTPWALLPSSFTIFN